jgi:septal ring factor EnvC (AmiA/AmiB activator)
MSETEDPSSGNLASHTLAFLRRLDRRLDESDKRFVHIVDLLSRQQTRLDRVERDLREARSDMILMENNIINRMNEALSVASRLNRVDERLEALEQASRPAPPAPTEGP